MERLRQTWDDLRDRYSASDPGLIRLSGALITVGGILLTLLSLSLLGTPVPLLVAGAMGAMAASFAISDPLPRDQAATLGLCVPTAFASSGLSALLHTNRVVTDLVFLALIFCAVYIRRYGPRGRGLGLIAFQLYFVSLFTHVTVDQLPRFYGVLAVAFASSGIVRFGLVRSTPQRVLGRLGRAFRARLGGVLEALTDVVEAPPGTVSLDRSLSSLQRRTARLHQCALMIQSRLEDGTQDRATAAAIQRRIAEAEIAAERLGVIVLHALRPAPDAEAAASPTVPAAAGDRPADAASTAADPSPAPGGETASGSNAITQSNPYDAITLGLHLPELLPSPNRDAVLEDGTGAHLTDPNVQRLLDELGALRTLVARPIGPTGDELPEVTTTRNRLLGYRDDENVPDTDREVQDAFRALGEVARAMLGVRLAFGNAPDWDDDTPETVRSREELETEDLSLAAEEQRDEEVPEPIGLQRPTTRAACQVVAGSAMAILGGELLSAQRWYWAVLTCWVVFINTASVGEILVKGYRRLAGTIAGVFAGIGLATLVGGNTWTAFTLAIVCVFFGFFLSPISYALMSFFVTAMLGLLYTLLHTYSPAVLVLRIEETALGSAAGLIAAMVVLPVRTGKRADEQLVTVLDRLRDALDGAVGQLTGEHPGADLLDAARELDTALDAYRTSVAPLTHPAAPQRARRRRARYTLGLLETCAYHTRSLAATAQLMPGALRIGADPRLAEAGRRLDRNLAVLSDFVETDGRPREPEPLEAGPNIAALLRPAAHGHPATSPGEDGATTAETRLESTIAQRVLRHLQRIDEGVLGLARPLGLRDR
jgi:uncharacterized membrane protein YccC